jgi:hypothetical protein
VAVVVATAFFAIGWAVLTRGHPHEDAYILFRYAENVAAGKGVVFWAGGPRTEGATDFLWLVLVSLGVAAGLDVAVAALAANAAGAGLAAWVLCRTVADARLPWGWTALLVVLFPFQVPFLDPANAAYGGFSAMLYAALYVLAFRVAVAARVSPVLLPAIALTIALFRPEGVVPAVGFVLVGAVRAFRAGRFRAFAAASAACGVAGGVYFVARWLYFGLALPLPLYVKLRGGAAGPLPGLRESWDWLVTSPGAIRSAAAVVLLLLVLRHRRPTEVRRIAVGLLPMAALLALLLVGHPSQNVDHRFQAPALLVLFYALARLTAEGVRAFPSLPVRVGLLLLVAAAVFPPRSAGPFRTRELVTNRHRTYLDTFAPVLGAALDRSHALALTEAGRLPFWTDARIEDVVGLNSPERALRPATPRSLETLDPQVLMFHHGHTMDTAALVAAAGGKGAVVAVDAGSLAASIRSRFRPIYDDLPQDYRGVAATPVEIAPLVMTRFLAERGGYDLFLVDSGGGGEYKHVYAFREGWRDTPDLLRALEATTAFRAYRSYFELRRADPRATGLLDALGKGGLRSSPAGAVAGDGGAP